MTDRPSLVVNVFYSALSWFSTIGLLIVNILAARVLGTEVYGRFAFAYALVALFEVLTDIGMREYLVREIARARDRTGAFLGEALALKTALCLVTIVVLAVVVWALGLSPESRTTVAVLCVAMVAKSYKLVLRAPLIAHERYRREAALAMADRLLVVVACAAALLLDGRLLTFVIAFAGAGVANLAVTALAAGSLRAQLGRGARARIVDLLRASIPFGLTAAAFLAYFRFDSVMLAIMRSEHDVGWYNAAYRLTEGLIVIPSLIQYAIFPRLSVLHKESRESTEQLGVRAVKYLAAIATPLAAIGILLARPLVVWIYGEEYLPTVESLQILLLGLPFMFAWSVLTVLLNATDRPKVPFVGVAVGATVNVLLNLFMIPWLGHLGASLSTVAAEIFLCTFLAHALRGAATDYT